MKHLKKFKSIEPEKKIEYHKNGNIKTIEYKLNDIYHREDGPAYQVWFLNGEKDYEMYFYNGEKHRENGPASIFYSNDKIISKYYYLNSIKYDREDWIEELKKINSPHYKEQQDLYDMEENMEKYNL